MSRALTIALAVAVVAGLAGCGQADKDAPGTVHVTIWTMWRGREEQNFRRVLDLFEREHPGIKVDNLGAIPDDTKTVRAIVAGVPPDLFTLVDPLYLGPLAANGALTNLDGYFAKSGLRTQDFIPAALSQCQFHGHLYALPFLIDDYALLWNKDHFRQAGLDPNQPPRTLEELEQYAIKLTKRRGSRITRLGMQPLSDIYLLSWLFGGRLADPSGLHVTPDAPQNVAALQWYCNLVNKLGGYQQVMGFQAGFGSGDSPNNPFIAGKVSMLLIGEWEPIRIQQFAPGMSYGVAPMPPLAAHPELARSTWLSGNMICIAKGAKHPKQAWVLLKWLQTYEAQVLFASLMNNVPNTRAALRAPVLREGAEYRRKFALFMDLADSPNGTHFPALAVANLYDAEMATATDLALSGAKTPEQALHDVRVRVQRDLDRYRE